MTTLNNLEKLIQMATIEQMYGMIQKMRDDFSGSISPVDNSRDKLNTDCIEICNDLKERVSNLEKTNTQLLSIIGTLTTKVSTFESSIHSLASEPINEQKQILKGQQLLTRYFDSPKEEEHIKLKIVEVLEEKSTTNINVIEQEEQEVEEEEAEEEVEEEAEVEVEAEEEVEVEDEEEVEEEAEVEAEEEVEVVEDEVVEDDVVTDEAVTDVVEEEQADEESDADSEEEVRTNDEIEEVPTLDVKNDEEEEEEVFEIEIDDVTYFATDEENGILYAVTDDGDIGEKVGILKDGEPIFT